MREAWSFSPKIIIHVHTAFAIQGMASCLAQTLGLPPLSSFADGDCALLRGHAHAHWVVPGRVLQGGYPGASDDEAAAGIWAALVGARVTHSVCLQEEKELRFLPPYFRTVSGPARVHAPVRDGGTAPDAELLALLEQLLVLLELPANVLYVHCMGGHGRSGVVCACLLARLYALDAARALALTSALHAARADDPFIGSHQSPETAEQRAQVVRIVSGRQGPMPAACRAHRWEEFGDSVDSNGKALETFACNRE